MSYLVLRKAYTERPYTGKYDYFYEKGTYHCAGCDEPLYSSSNKYNSFCGWPSFDKEISDKLVYDVDYKLGYPRTEIKGNGLNYIISNLTDPTNIKNIEIANEFFKRQLVENDNIVKPTELFPFIFELITFAKTLSSEYEYYKKSILDNYTILPLEAAEIMQVASIEETVNSMVDEAGGQ